MPQRNPDSAILDWLGTFAGSIEYDDVHRTFTVRTREPGYPHGRGRNIRAAARDAIDGRRP